MIEQATVARLRTLYQNLEEQPLPPGDPRYVPLFEDPALSRTDPVARLAGVIRFAAKDSSQLFSGHRGTGKSTQLLRLAHELARDPSYKVVVCDMEQYLPMSAEVDVADFLLAAAGALSEGLSAPELLGADPAYWGRFVDWLRGQKIAVEELGLGAKASVAPGVEVSANIKLNLKSDDEFRKRIRERMQLHVGAFRAEVHTFVGDCLKALRKRHGPETQLVIVYDSIEHLLGTTQNAKAVADSLEQLFRGHGPALRFPYVHTIYTVPPWLRLQLPGLGSGVFDDYCQIPCVKVRARPDEPGTIGDPSDVGLEALWRVANARGDMHWLLGDRAAFDEIVLASGGYLRDLFRVLKTLTVDAPGHGVPVGSERRQLAIAELREAYLGFTNDEAKWLQAIEQTGTLDVAAAAERQTIARFFDTHVLLAYRNGSDWYAVHPVIRDDVARRAAKAKP